MWHGRVAMLAITGKPNPNRSRNPNPNPNPNPNTNPNPDQASPCRRRCGARRWSTSRRSSSPRRSGTCCRRSSRVLALSPAPLDSWVIPGEQAGLARSLEIHSTLWTKRGVECVSAVCPPTFFCFPLCHFPKREAHIINIFLGRVRPAPSAAALSSIGYLSAAELLQGTWAWRGLRPYTHGGKAVYSTRSRGV